MLTLLGLTAIPSVTGISLGISERSKPETQARERARMRKFTLTAWCAGRSPGKAAVHGGDVVLGDGQMWIQTRRHSKTQRPQNQKRDDDDDKPFHPFDGFYIDYPDDLRPPPPPTGLCTLVSASPPLMNWIYIDSSTRQVRHGNRTTSRPHRVGDFGWTSDEDDDFAVEPGGLTCDGEERFVAVQPRAGSEAERAGRWEVYWDENDDKLAGIDGRLVLRVSLERAYLEEALGPKAGEPGTGMGTTESGSTAAASGQVKRVMVNGKPSK